jgi:hypothetical protein
MTAMRTLEIKTLYSVPELARAVGWSIPRTRRLLKNNRVTFVESGRALYVPRTVLEKVLPDLWESLVDPVGTGGPW